MLLQTDNTLWKNVKGFLLHMRSAVLERAIGENDFLAVIRFALEGDSRSQLKQRLALIEFRIDELPCNRCKRLSERCGELIDIQNDFILRNRSESFLVHVVITLRQ